MQETLRNNACIWKTSFFLIYFNFFPKVFFPKFELPNSGASLSASATYTPVFTVLTAKCFKVSSFVTFSEKTYTVKPRFLKLKGQLTDLFKPLLRKLYSCITLSPVLSISFEVDVPTGKVGGRLLFECRRREFPRGVWGHAPQKILKFRYLEMLFSTFSRQYLGLKNKCYINHIPCLLQPFFSSKSQSLAFRKSEMINLQMLNQKVHSMF